MIKTSNSAQPRTTRDWHLYHLSRDREFNDTLDELEIAIRSNIDDATISDVRSNIAKSNNITLQELGSFEIGRILYLDTNQKTTELNCDFSTLTATISFDITKTTKAELIEQFDIIEKLRKNVWQTQPKFRTGVRNPELVFAIFKARQKNISFNEIYELYEACELPYYTKKPTQFKDTKQLENFYNLYKP